MAAGFHLADHKYKKPYSQVHISCKQYKFIYTGPVESTDVTVLSQGVSPLTVNQLRKRATRNTKENGIDQKVILQMMEQRK